VTSAASTYKDGARQCRKEGEENSGFASIEHGREMGERVCCGSQSVLNVFPQSQTGEGPYREGSACSSDEDEREDVERAEASMECYVGPRVPSRAPGESPCVSKAS
jgi:hypothetical protein